MIPGIVGLVALLFGIAIGSAGSDDSETASETITSTVTATATATLPASAAEQQRIDEEQAALDQRQKDLDTRESAISTAEAEAAASTISTDGTFVVNEDIIPGTWRSSGGDGCYWERLSGLGGSFEDIIANSLGDGPQVVTIDGSDMAFSTERCGEWTRVR